MTTSDHTPCLIHYGSLPSIKHAEEGQLHHRLGMSILQGEDGTRRTRSMSCYACSAGKSWHTPATRTYYLNRFDRLGLVSESAAEANFAVKLIKDAAAHMYEAHGDQLWPQGMSGEDERFERGYLFGYLIRHRGTRQPLTGDDLEWFAVRLGGKSARLRAAFDRGFEAALAEQQADSERREAEKAAREATEAVLSARRAETATTLGDLMRAREERLEALESCPGCEGSDEHRPSCVESVLEHLRAAITSDGDFARQRSIMGALQAMADYDRLNAAHGIAAADG